MHREVKANVHGKAWALLCFVHRLWRALKQALQRPALFLYHNVTRPNIKYMKKTNCYLLPILLLLSISAFSNDIPLPVDSIRIDTLFTLANKDVNQIYKKTMSLKYNQDYDKAYYENYFINDKNITIGNIFNYDSKYSGSIVIEKKPLGLAHNVDFKSISEAHLEFRDDPLNAEIKGDSQFTSYFRINLGDISYKTKYPYLKIKYKASNRDLHIPWINIPTLALCECYAYYSLDANRAVFYVFTGNIQVANNSISNLPFVSNQDSLGNFFKISPLADTSIYPLYINKYRSDNIYSHNFIPKFNINSTDGKKLDIDYIIDTIIPLWNNTNLKDFDIIIRGSGITLLDDIKIIGIDTGNFTGISEFDIKNDISFSNNKFIATPQLQSEINNIKVFNMSGQLIMEGGLNDAFPLNKNTFYFCLFNDCHTKKIFVLE